jgi:hypothetical protein
MTTPLKEKTAAAVVEQLLAGKAVERGTEKHSAAVQREMSQLVDAATAMIYDAEQEKPPARKESKP